MMKYRKILSLILFISAASASASIFLNSFNSGQLSKDMKQRHDLDRTAMGSEELTNILIRPQGMAFRRPGTEFIATGAGTYTPPVDEIPAIPATYKFTYISENASIWGMPVGDGEMAGLDAGGVAVDVGGGVVGLPFAGHPFTIGESIQITGTTNYDGSATVGVGTTEDQLQITSGYTAETFDGTEHIIKLIGSLNSGGGDMVQDSDGNMYFGHSLTHNDGDNKNYYITRISPDGTLTYDYDFLNTSWDWGSGRIINGIAIDDTYLYFWIEIDGPTDYGYMNKWNLDTKARLWEADGQSWPGYSMAIDSEGNAYASSATYFLMKFASANGSVTPEIGAQGVYDVVIDEDIGVILSAHGGTSGQLRAINMDTSSKTAVTVGNSALGTGHVVTDGSFIYALGYISGTPTLYKITWDGTTLAIDSSAAGPTYGVGLYIDLYGNIVVVNQDWTTTQNDLLYFYDTGLNYIGKISNLSSGAPLRTWDSSAGGSWIQGNAVFDGDLGTPGTAGVPGSWSYSGLDPNDRDCIRLIPFEYAVNDAYVLELGHEYIGFLRTTQ